MAELTDLQHGSMVALKAELARKQVDFRLKKLGVPDSVLPKPMNKTLKQQVEQNKGVAQRAKRDESTIEDVQPLQQSARKLQEKAALYEKLSKRQLTDAEQEIYLVDFEKKDMDGLGARERTPTPPPSNPEEEWVTFTDALGRERRCLRKDLQHYKQMDAEIRTHEYDPRHGHVGSHRSRNSPDRDTREQRPVIEEPEVEPGPVHYQVKRHQEIRELGVGYFKFSTDEETRQQELMALHKLREETEKQRDRQDKLKKRRQDQASERLRKIKMRKEGKLAKDVTPEPEPETPAESVPFSDIDTMLEFYRKKTAEQANTAGSSPS